MIHDAKALTYITDVASALEGLEEENVDWGTFHISKVSFGFDGDDDDTYSLVPRRLWPSRHPGVGMSSQVDHPVHYRSHPSGVECITITEHMNFCVGNAMKYLWRAGSKGNEIEDLRKAQWYISREITFLSSA